MLNFQVFGQKISEGYRSSPNGTVKTSQYAGQNILEGSDSSSDALCSISAKDTVVIVEDVDKNPNLEVGFKKMANGETRLTVTNSDGGDRFQENFVELSFPVNIDDPNVLGRDSVFSKEGNFSHVTIAQAEDGSLNLWTANKESILADSASVSQGKLFKI